MGAIAFESEGDVLFLAGQGTPALGGSEYLAFVHGKTEGPPPPIDWEVERRAGQLVRDAVKSGLARTAHDVSDGGIAIAIAECALARRPAPLGARVTLPKGSRGDVTLFGESHGRYLVTVAKGREAELEALAKKTGAALARIGTVGGDRLVIEGLLDEPLAGLEKAWTSFPWQDATGEKK